ncbi:tail fiber protein [Magnetovibrio sp. PR-2]|uniref:phage tail protein n=1 Tax=Magnetovibrio sp. PR-2 TaxID=3120356 RepID=UPI002FCE590A
MKPTKMLKSVSMGFGIMALGFITDTATNEAHATCVPEPYIGSVCITAGPYCPRDYVELNGGVLPISEYMALFALINTSFGGNGTTTMGIPDLRGRSPIHHGTGPGLLPADFGVARGGGTVTVANTGEGEPITNLPPQLSMRFCMAVDGVFPPRGDTTVWLGPSK